MVEGQGSFVVNMRVLKKSRVAPVAGDIFALQLELLPDRFFFGRVARVGATVGGFDYDPKTILIYLYRTSAPSKDAIPALTPSDLLVPPMATNRLPWSRGYFEGIGHRSLAPSDLLPRHVFYSLARKRLLDEFGREVAAAEGPVGDYALHSFRTIDDEISKALGLPLSE